jgi:hypothetical protein
MGLFEGGGMGDIEAIGYCGVGKLNLGRHTTRPLNLKLTI